MNKTDLINSISKRAGITKKSSEAALNAMLESITETLAKGDSVKLTGFGTFAVRKRSARKGRNPQNPKEVIHIPETMAPIFKAGQKLKEKVN